jgi:Ala-tRNA(Pro) deacylase
MAMRKRAKKAVKKVVKKAKRGRPAKKTTKKKATRRKKKVAKKKPAKKRKSRKVVKKTKSAKSKGTAGAAPAALRKSVKVIKPKSSVSPKPFVKATLSNQKIKEFLASKHLTFEVLQHSPAFTAQQIAASAHISGKNLAKTVIVKIDGKMAMVVEPGHLKVDLDALRQQLNAQHIELATEMEFRSHFPECELGAMPPFGDLYKMDVYVSNNVTRDQFISFNAGSHSELIKMAYKDFYSLVHPKVVYA